MIQWKVWLHNTWHHSMDNHTAGAEIDPGWLTVKNPNPSLYFKVISVTYLHTVCNFISLNAGSSLFSSRNDPLLLSEENLREMFKLQQNYFFLHQCKTALTKQTEGVIVVMHQFSFSNLDSLFRTCDAGTERKCLCRITKMTTNFHKHVASTSTIWCNLFIYSFIVWKKGKYLESARWPEYNMVIWQKALEAAWPPAALWDNCMRKQRPVIRSLQIQ